MFGIKRKDRRQHMYVLGKSGTGKSVMLENMIIQNIHQGEGVCVVDPHGELVEKILETIPPERVNDVVYFNPADTDYNIGFNVLQLDDPRYKHLVASGLMGIFTKIWANAWSSRMEYILNNTILALLDTPDTTLLGIPRMLVDKDYRQYIINNLKDPVVKAFWVHEYEAWRDQFRNEAIAPIQNKVGQFLSSNIVRNVVGQTRSTINIFDIMNNKKIFLVNVSKGRIGEDNSALLGGMLITKLQLSAMERVRIPENQREDFYLYVDEFQNFVTDSFASILSEARKYRLCLIIAHQYIAQLETADSKTVKDAVFGNVGTMVIFRVGADDADALEKEFEPEFVVEDFVNLPNYHIYNKLMVDGVTSRPFSAKTLPPVNVQTSDEIRNSVIETSRNNFTRRRSEVEAEIQKWSSTVPGTTRPDGEEVEGKFKATCSNCGKDIYVPFEPEAGRPIYCKECLFKIKNGEVEAAAGFRPPKEKRDNISYDALASLGIEFKTEVRSPAPARYDRPAPRPLAPGAGSSNAPRFVPRPATPTPNPAPVTATAPAVPAPVTNIPSAAPVAPRPAPTAPRPPTVATPTQAPASAGAPRPQTPPPAFRPTPRPAPIRPQQPVRTQQDENMPPQGMIRADARDMAIAKAMSERQAPSDVSLPNPRVVRTPIRKERKMPDTSGLQSLLKDALGGVLNSSKPQPRASEASQAEEQQPSAPKPTMSLDSLKKATPSHFISPTKDAMPERQTMLKDAISLAMGERISAVEEKVTEVQEAIDTVQDDVKEAQEKIQAEADQKKEAERAEEEQLQKEKIEKEREETRLKMEKEIQEKMEREIEAEKKRLQEAEVARLKALDEAKAKAEEERKAAEIERDRLKEELRQTEIRAREVEAEKKRLRDEEEARLKVEREMKDLAEKEAKEKQQKEQQEKEQKAKAEQEREEHEKLAKEEALRKLEDDRLPPPKVPVSEPEQPPKAKKAKEIPEDLLKQILD